MLDRYQKKNEEVIRRRFKGGRRLDRYQQKNVEVIRRRFKGGRMLETQEEKWSLRRRIFGSRMHGAPLH